MTHYDGALVGFQVWFVVSFISTLFIIPNGFIFCIKQRSGKYKLMRIWSTLTMVAGVVYCVTNCVRYISGLCYVTWYLSLAALRLQPIFLGNFQLSRLYYCFAARPEGVGQKGYPRWVFVIMFSASTLLMLSVAIPYGFQIPAKCYIDSEYVYHAQYLNHYLSTSLELEQRTYVEMGVFMVWDLATLLLYCLKVQGIARTQITLETQHNHNYNPNQLNQVTHSGNVPNVPNTNGTPQNEPPHSAYNAAAVSPDDIEFVSIFAAYPRKPLPPRWHTAQAPPRRQHPLAPSIGNSGDLEEDIDPPETTPGALNPTGNTENTENTDSTVDRCVTPRDSVDIDSKNTNDVNSEVSLGIEIKMTNDEDIEMEPMDPTNATTDVVEIAQTATPVDSLRIYRTLYRVLTVTVFYEMVCVVIFAVNNVVLPQLDLQAVEPWLTIGELLLVTTWTLSAHLMLDHNKKSYLYFLETLYSAKLHYICCCWRYIVLWQLEDIRRENETAAEEQRQQTVGLKVGGPDLPDNESYQTCTNTSELWRNRRENKDFLERIQAEKARQRVATTQREGGR